MWAQDIAHAQLAGSMRDRWAHVSSVAAEASRISRLFGDEGSLLVASAWLHDVGYAPSLSASGFHPVDGARFLAEAGGSTRLCALVARHSCAIREAALRGRREDVEAYVDEASPLRDALWYCDMVTGPRGQRFTVDERLAEIGVRYGVESVVGRFIVEARADLIGAVDRTLLRMEDAGIALPQDD